jgi:hypothetical protein
VAGREGLIERIRHLRRTAEASRPPTTAPSVDPAQDHLGALEARIEHLEKLVQGLQDSVHRESTRQAKRVAALEARLEPGALSKALSDDARERGL